MARKPRESSLETRTARDKLPQSKRAYWRQITTGVFVGYAKGGKRTSWIARWRDADGYREQRIGIPDDYADADGEAVLTYGQACDAARSRAAGKETRPAARFIGDAMTVSRAIEEYLAWRRDDRPNSSANETDRIALAHHVVPKFKGRTVNSLTTKEIQTWLAGVAKSAPTVRGPKGSRRKVEADMHDPEVMRGRRLTANRVWNVFKAALNHAWRDESNRIESDSAWRRVRPLDIDDAGPPRMLEHDEAVRLLNCAKGDHRNLLHAALLTGARYGELVALRVRDFLPEQGSIVIRQRKTGKTLIQPLTVEGQKFFDGLCAGRDPDAIILQNKGREWRKSEQFRPMREASAKAKLPGISFKVTRATYGKMLLLATRDIELVAKALGHSDSRVTRKHYAQYLPNEVAEGVRKMPALGLEGSNVTRLRTRKASGNRR